MRCISFLQGSSKVLDSTSHGDRPKTNPLPDGSVDQPHPRSGVSFEDLESERQWAEIELVHYGTRACARFQVQAILASWPLSPFPSSSRLGVRTHLFLKQHLRLDHRSSQTLSPLTCASTRGFVLSTEHSFLQSGALGRQFFDVGHSAVLPSATSQAFTNCGCLGVNPATYLSHRRGQCIGWRSRAHLRGEVAANCAAGFDGDDASARIISEEPDTTKTASMNWIVSWATNGYTNGDATTKPTPACQ
jgi:hypothetical protein